MAACTLLALTGCEELSARRQVQDANKLYSQGRFSEAVGVYEKALEKADLPIGHYNAGLAYLKLFKAGIETPENRRYAERATHHFQKYLEVEPDDSHIVGLMTQMWLDSGQYEKALAFWETELDDDPQNTEVIAYLASINRQAGDWEKAIEWRRRQAEAEPTDEGRAGAYLDIAKLLWHKLRPKGEITGLERLRMADIAIAALQQAGELEPGNVDVHRYLASLYQFRARGHGAAWAQAVDRASSQIHQSKVLELTEEQQNQQDGGDDPSEAAEGSDEAKKG